MTATGALIGSPAYMSPEASLGHEPVPLSDVYSLACSMFQTLAGRPPYHATSTLQVLHQHVSAPPPSFAAARSDLVLLEPLLTRCLSKQAKDRPAPEVVARELAAIAASIPAHARCATPGQARLLPAARPPPTATAIVATVPAPNLPHQRLLVLGAVVVGLLGMLVTIGVLKKLPRGEPPATVLVESDASAPPTEPVPVAPAAVTTSRITPLLAGSGMLGAELAPGHPLAPVGAPAPAGQAPRLLMSQQGRLRLRPPPGSGHLALVLHPGSGSEEREMWLDGRSLRLRPGVWQVVEQPCSGKQELVLEAVGSAPFYCAAAVASPFGLSWQDLGVNASALLAPGVAPLRLLLTHHHLTADYSRTVFVAKPLAMRLFGDAARQHIAAAFVQGQAPESLLIETQEVSDAVRQAIQGGTRWCFMLLDAGDVPTGTLRADNWCVVVEDALRQGTLIIPVLGGLPTARNQNLWATWFEQVGKRLPGLPVLDLSAVHEFHSANDLPPADARAMAEGLAVALRDLRARLTTALRPLP